MDYDEKEADFAYHNPFRYLDEKRENLAILLMIVVYAALLLGGRWLDWW